MKIKSSIKLKNLSKKYGVPPLRDKKGKKIKSNATLKTARKKLS